MEKTKHNWKTKHGKINIIIELAQILVSNKHSFFRNNKKPISTGTLKCPRNFKQNEPG
jgi:hypothetical protein